MRTLSQIYDTDYLIELGSSQYDSIAKAYELYDEKQMPFPDFYKNILENFQEEFKKELYLFLKKEYTVYQAVLDKEMKELTEKEKEEFFFDVYTDQEAFERMKEVLSNEPFKFPVKPHLQKIALLEFVEFKKNQSYDLWTLIGYLRRNLFRNMMPYFRGTMEASHRSDAALIYTLKVVLDLDHTTITKYFGGFDT